MKVLVVGSGGREHALVKGLKHSYSVTEVHALPGREGFAQDEAICHAIDMGDFEGILRIIKQVGISCVVIGPEDVLANGLSDYLRSEGVLVVGPSQKAAQLESSKVYAKEFMLESQVPTARFLVVDSVESTMKAALEFQAPYVLKADGLAAGKGVFICSTKEELKSAATELFEHKILKEAGQRALLEEFQEGWELSYLVLTNGEDFQALPVSQDNKRLLDNDKGPNTGGMGVVGPVPLEANLKTQIEKKIIKPTIEGLKRESLLYRGVLYVGVMVTKDGPTVIEYNVRFGDPEAQVIIPLLDGDWGETFKKLSRGLMPDLEWKPLSVACVVLASEGYPSSPKKGVTIGGDLLHEEASSYFLHAGTMKNKSGQWVTGGGRVLNSIGIGSDLKEAIAKAYQQSQFAYWQGCQKRTDIGKKLEG